MEEHEAVSGLIAAMEASGIRPVESLAHRLGDARVVRFRAEGDKPGRLNGWAVLHLDGMPAGAFGHYRLGISETWRASSSQRLSPTDYRRRNVVWRAREQARDVEKRLEWEKASVEAQTIVAAARDADPQHPYLVNKRASAEGVKQNGRCLIIPMADASGKVWSLQHIDPDGAKRFLQGGRTHGLFHIIGQPGPVVCVGEGFSTMAAVRRATGYAVVIAFSAKNLLSVTLQVREKFPVAELILCADDDAHLIDHPTIHRNIGLDSAQAAAEAVGARLAIPKKA